MPSLLQEKNRLQIELNLDMLTVNGLILPALVHYLYPFWEMLFQILYIYKYLVIKMVYQKAVLITIEGIPFLLPGGHVGQLCGLSLGTITVT